MSKFMLLLRLRPRTERFHTAIGLPRLVLTLSAFTLLLRLLLAKEEEEEEEVEQAALKGGRLKYMVPQVAPLSVAHLALQLEDPLLAHCPLPCPEAAVAEATTLIRLVRYIDHQVEEVVLTRQMQRQESLRNSVMQRELKQTRYADK